MHLPEVQARAENKMNELSFFVPVASNRKLAPVHPKTLKPLGPFVAATYASISVTCPTTCMFRNNGCYAEGGFVGLKAGNLAGIGTPWDAAWNEASHILKFIGESGGRVPQDGGRQGDAGRDLRLHVSGDCKEPEAVDIFAAMERTWRNAGGGQVWTYTHAWRTVGRHRWGGVSVLASCETPEDIKEARARGYTPSLTIRSHRGATKAYSIPGIEGKLIPCPAETKKTSCVKCRLCFDDKKLEERKNIITFALHGDSPTLKKAKRALPILDSLFGTMK